MASTDGDTAAFPTPAAVLDTVADLSRRQLAAAVEGSCALFRGFEAMRRIQEEAAHAALAQYEEAAGKLARPCHPLELLGIQAELLRYDTQAALQYWQQLGATALDMQRRMAGTLGAAESAALKDAVSTMQDLTAAMPGGGRSAPGNGRTASSRRAH